MVSVQNRDECYLGGTWFKLRSPVRATNITATPNPVVFGDTSKATDTQATSQFIQSDSLGGSGIYKGDIRTQFDRDWWSRAETRWKYISLPPLTIDMGSPAENATLSLVYQYGGEIGYAFGTDVYAYLFDTDTWDTVQVTLAGVPTDGVEYRGMFFIANGSDDIDVNTVGTWSVITSVGASWLCVHDGKLYALGIDSGVWRLRASTDGVTFAAALGDFTEGVTPNGLAVFRDAAGDQRLYAPTDKGLYIWNDTTTEWLRTDVRYPSHLNAGKSPIVFRDGRMYLKSGSMSVLALDIGSTVVITPVGLDRDDGVPPEDYGEIVALAADYNWLWALVDASSSDGVVEDSYSGLDFPMVSSMWSLASGKHTLRAWNGGWHTPWENPEGGYPASALGVFITGDDQLIVTWGSSRRAYYHTIPFGIYNARNNPDWKFAKGPVSHVTPWWDFGSSSQIKRIAHLPVEVLRASETETVDVYIGYDLSEDWEYIGRITESGLTTLKLDNGYGQSARYFRFRFVLQRGDDDSKSPIIEFYNAEHMRLLPATYGFGIEMDLTGDYKNKTSAQMLAALKRFADAKQTPKLIEFSYLDTLSGVPQTYLVQVSRLAGIEYPGSELRGQGAYTVSLIAPYTEDVVS